MPTSKAPGGISLNRDAWVAVAVVAFLLLFAVVILELADGDDERLQETRVGETPRATAGVATPTPTDGDDERLQETSVSVTPGATAGVATPTPTSVDVNRCSSSPNCKLDITSDVLKRHFQSSGWQVEGSQGLPGKWAYTATAAHLNLVATWVDYDGIQLFELISALPSGCNVTLGTGLFVQRELKGVLDQVETPNPGTSNFLWNEACALADRQKLDTKAHVVGDVMVQVAYIPIPAIAISMWACGRKDTGTCRWTRS